MKDWMERVLSVLEWPGPASLEAADDIASAVSADPETWADGEPVVDWLNDMIERGSNHEAAFAAILRGVILARRKERA